MPEQPFMAQLPETAQQHFEDVGATSSPHWEDTQKEEPPLSSRDQDLSCVSNLQGANVMSLRWKSLLGVEQQGPIGCPASAARSQ